MGLNKTIIGRRGETGFCFHTPLIDAAKRTLILTDIDFPNCDARLWVTPKAGGDPIIGDVEMTAHPDQITFPEHIAYFATEDEMQNPAGEYNWQIVFTDTTGKVTTYPKDGDNDYGSFLMLETLATLP